MTKNVDLDLRIFIIYDTLLLGKGLNQYYDSPLDYRY